MFIFTPYFQYKFTAFQIALQYQLNIARIQQTQMTKKIASKPIKKIVKPIEKESSLRRSVRERKQPKEDQFWRGNPNQFTLFAADVSDDQNRPRRKKKTTKNYQDSQDYENGTRAARRRVINLNKIQGLLDWRDHIEEQQLRVITDITDPSAKPPPLSKERVSKNIVSQKLEDIAQNIEALFVNIDWGKKGQTLQDFEKLKIESTKFMSKGLAFVWAPKQLVADILEIMVKKGFFYVQNCEVIHLDREKAIRNYCPPSFGGKKDKLSKQKSQTSSQQLSEPQAQLKDIVKYLQGVQPEDLIIECPSPYFNSSKRTLLMFRKTSTQKIELRHQRTCDVVFDMPVNPYGKCEPETKRYIYSLIQTLLPEATLIEYRNKSQLAFKMVELWADKGHQRRGWVSVVQQ